LGDQHARFLTVLCLLPCRGLDSQHIGCVRSCDANVPSISMSGDTVQQIAALHRDVGGADDIDPYVNRIEDPTKLLAL